MVAGLERGEAAAAAPAPLQEPWLHSGLNQTGPHADIAAGASAGQLEDETWTIAAQPLLAPAAAAVVESGALAAGAALLPQPARGDLPNDRLKLKLKILDDTIAGACELAEYEPGFFDAARALGDNLCVVGVKLTGVR